MWSLPHKNLDKSFFFDDIYSICHPWAYLWSVLKVDSFAIFTGSLFLKNGCKCPKSTLTVEISSEWKVSDKFSGLVSNRSGKVKMQHDHARSKNKTVQLSGKIWHCLRIGLHVRKDSKECLERSLNRRKWISLDGTARVSMYLSKAFNGLQPQGGTP